MKSLLAASVSLFVVALANDARADEPPPPRSVVMISAMLFGRSITAIGGGRESALAGIPDLRHPQWWGPDPPKPPALHVRLFRITF